jgi:hypothetical protein
LLFKKRKAYKKYLSEAGPTQVLTWEGGQANQQFDELVQPMVRNTPEWYKQTQRWVKDATGREWAGVKHCMPFLDALTTGYAVFLAEDIVVKIQEDGSPTITHKNRERGPVNNRPPQVTDPSPHPAGCYPEHYIWSLPVAIEIPKGYSVLFTHPLNRWDLPFISTSAIVDDYNVPGANMAFHLKRGFEGVIPAGTMIAQLIPFRREEWVNKEVKNKLWAKGHMNKHSDTFVPDEELFNGWYRKNIWKKKSYR